MSLYDRSGHVVRTGEWDVRKVGFLLKVSAHENT